MHKRTFTSSCVLYGKAYTLTNYLERVIVHLALDGWIGNRWDCFASILSLLVVLLSVNNTASLILDNFCRLLDPHFNSALL